MRILEEDLHDHHCVAGSHTVILSATAAFGMFKFISFKYQNTLMWVYVGCSAVLLLAQGSVCSPVCW